MLAVRAVAKSKRKASGLLSTPAKIFGAFGESWLSVRYWRTQALRPAGVILQPKPALS